MAATDVGTSVPGGDSSPLKVVSTADNSPLEVVSTADNSPLELVSDAANEELRLLHDVIHSLPPAPLKDLLSLQVCPQCILRLLGKYGPSYCNSSSILNLFSEVLGHQLSSNDASSGESVNKDSVCSVCYGILQFAYVDERQALVKKDCASDLAVSIAALAKREGHQVDGFSLEVAIPAIILENDNAKRSFMKVKYGSEAWLRDVLQSETLSVKDALKLSIIEPLESQFGVKSGTSSFRVRLTYTCSEQSPQALNGKESKQAHKRQKTGVNNSIETTNGFNDSVQLKDKISSSLGKVSACYLTIQCHRSPIYVGGRYLKFSRNVSQTRWIIDDERMGEASVEEIVASSVLPMCKGDNCKFHAAGREDIDVRMLGSGRPFLLEIQNPRVVPSELSVREMEGKINSSNSELVKVKNLKVVDEQGWTLMREGEAEKQKQYAALVWISRDFEDKDLETISLLKDMKVLQRTPVRVLHRRSPLDREKIIHWMKVEKITGSTQYFLLHLCTQAGTYIKEFVHGDLGRTQPSLGSILGCRAEILQLDVTDVKMDCFMSE